MVQKIIRAPPLRLWHGSWNLKSGGGRPPSLYLDHPCVLSALDMPYISAEALIGAALVVVLAVGYQYMPTSGSETAGGAKKNNKKKNKKKSKGGELSSVPVSEVESDAGKHVKKKDKRKAKGKSEAKVIKTAAGPTGTAHKVEEAKSESESPEPPSFAAAAGSNPTRPKTLAEKLVPKPRKTKVDE